MIPIYVDTKSMKVLLKTTTKVEVNGVQNMSIEFIDSAPLTAEIVYRGAEAEISTYLRRDIPSTRKIMQHGVARNGEVVVDKGDENTVKFSFLVSEAANRILSENGLLEKCANLDEKTQGILIGLDDANQLKAEIVSGSMRPELICKTSAGTQVKARPYEIMAQSESVKQSVEPPTIPRAFEQKVEPHPQSKQIALQSSPRPEEQGWTTETTNQLEIEKASTAATEFFGPEERETDEFEQGEMGVSRSMLSSVQLGLCVVGFVILFLGGMFGGNSFFESMKESSFLSIVFIVLYIICAIWFIMDIVGDADWKDSVIKKDLVTKIIDIGFPILIVMIMLLLSVSQIKTKGGLLGGSIKGIPGISFYLEQCVLIAVILLSVRKCSSSAFYRKKNDRKNYQYNGAESYRYNRSYKI